MSNDPKPPLSQRDLAAAFEGPAISVNRIIVNLSGNGVRLSFCEQETPEGQIHHRAAVLLSFPDALEAGRLLVSMIEPLLLTQQSTH